MSLSVFSPVNTFYQRHLPCTKFLITPVPNNGTGQNGWVSLYKISMCVANVWFAFLPVLITLSLDTCYFTFNKLVASDEDLPILILSRRSSKSSLHSSRAEGREGVLDSRRSSHSEASGTSSVSSSKVSSTTSTPLLKPISYDQPGEQTAIEDYSLGEETGVTHQNDNLAEEEYPFDGISDNYSMMSGGLSSISSSRRGNRQSTPRSSGVLSKIWSLVFGG